MPLEKEEEKKQIEKRKEKKNQTKFFVDLRTEEKELRRIFNLLKQANNKSYGKKIIFKDLALFAIEKISQKDLEKIKELSLSKWRKYKKFVMSSIKKITQV